MESRAFSMTYLHAGGQGTAVIYAASLEAAKAEFHRTFHPSKALVKAEPVTDWAPAARPNLLFPIIP